MTTLNLKCPKEKRKRVFMEMILEKKMLKTSLHKESKVSLTQSKSLIFRNRIGNQRLPKTAKLSPL